MRTLEELTARNAWIEANGLGFATIDRATGAVIGGTAFLAPDEVNRNLELLHAFEVLACERVLLKTDARNERSRRAIARLGATEEGPFVATCASRTTRGATASTSP